MFELAGKEKRELGLRFELGLKPEQFAQAASDDDAEADCQIGPSGSFTGKECFGSAYDSVGIGQEAGVLEPILHPVVDGLVNLGPSFRVEAYDLQSRMILAEPAFDLISDVNDIVLLLPRGRKIALAEVCEQGIEPFHRRFDVMGGIAQAFQLVQMS